MTINQVYTDAKAHLINAKKLAKDCNCSIENALQALEWAHNQEALEDKYANNHSHNIDVIDQLSEIARGVSGIDYEIKNGLHSVSTQLKINLGWIGEEISKR